MVVMPLRATAPTGEPELSSIFQPLMLIAADVLLVSSNQSAPTGLLLLDQGATSEMNSLPIVPTVPGEPISFVSFTAAAAPSVPIALSVVIVELFRPAALLKVGKSGPPGEAPKLTLACSRPVALNRLTLSPPLLRPTPEPV